MALQKNKFNLSVVGGLDTKTDSKNVAAVDFLELENVKYTDTKAFKKADGNMAMTVATIDSAFNSSLSINQTKSQLVQVAKEGVFSYSPERTAWKYLNLFPVCKQDKTGLTSNLAAIQGPQTRVGENDDYIVAVYQVASGDYNVDVFDKTTNTLIKQYTFTPSTPTNARVTYVDYLSSKFFIFIDDGGSVVVYTFDSATLGTLTGPTFGLAASVTGNMRGYCKSGSKLFVTGSSTAAGGSVTISSIDSSLTISTGTVLTGFSTVGLRASLCSSGVDDVRLFVASTSGGYKTGVYTNGLATVLAATTVFSGTSSTDVYLACHRVESSVNQGLLLLSTDDGTSTGRVTAYGFVDASGVVFGSGIVIRNWYVASNIVYVNENYYFAAFNPSRTSPAPAIGDLFIVSVGGAVVSRFESINGTFLNTSSPISLFKLNESGSTITIGSSNQSESGFTNQYSFTINRNVFEPSKSSFVKPVNFDFGTYYNSAIPYYYDGVSFVEDGFLEPVAIVSTTVGAGGSIPVGSYELAAIYSWYDVNGQKHVSAPVTATATTSGGNQTITIVIKNLRVTQKQTTYIELYITEASGTLHYLTSISKIDTSAKNTTVVLTSAAVANTANPVLYTDSDELENNVPPTTSFLAPHKTRVFSINEDSLTLSYSKQRLEATPIEWNANLTLQLGAKGGKPKALASLDEILAIFKETAIYVLGGDGPNDLGVGGYNPPSLVPGDIGCSEPRSVISTPVGIFFKSVKGLHVFGRGQTVQYIGDKVEDYNSETIVESILHETKNEVWFITNAGNCLIYDYYAAKWTVRKNFSFTSACTYNGVFHAAKSTGVVHYETPGAYSDNGSYIAGKIVTSWVALGELQGYQRLYVIYILGKYVGAHNLTVSIAYDYDDTYVDTYTHAVSSDPTNYEYQFFPKIQKCTAFKLKIEDSSLSGPTGGFILSNIAVRVGVKASNNQLASSKGFALT